MHLEQSNWNNIIIFSCHFSTQAKSPHIPEEGRLPQGKAGMEARQSPAEEGGEK